MAKSSTTTEVATNTGTDLEVRREAMRQQIAQAISEMKSDEFDPEQAMFDIMEATSIDDILDSSVLHLKDIIGTPMTIESAQLQESAFADSFMPAYAVMRVKFDDGTSAIVTTGAAQVVSTLVKAQTAGWFPFRCSSSITTARSGNDVVKLTKAPEPSF